MNKKLLAFSFSVLFSGVAISQSLWDDFEENRNASYGFRNGVLNENFDNPDKTGINDSEKCARYIRNTDVEFDVIIIDPASGFAIGDVSDIVDGVKKMSMKVRTSNLEIDTVQITFESSTAIGEYPDGRHSEYRATTSGSGAWEELEFEFINRPDENIDNSSVDRIVILFAPGIYSDITYLFDDLIGPDLIDLCDGVQADASIIDDFQCNRNINNRFSNGTLDIVNNPVQDGNNDAEKVGRFTKYIPPSNDGAFGGDLVNPFTSDQYMTFHINLYDPNAPQDLRIVFQDAGGNDLIEHSLQTSSTEDWEEFLIDISEIPSAVSIEKIVLQLNATSDTEDFIYLDKLALSNVLSIDEFKADVNIKAYPNPVTNSLNIDSDKLFKNITLTDNTGKTFYQSNTIGNTRAIDFGSFAKGIYHVKVTFEDNSIYNLKVIK